MQWSLEQEQAIEICTDLQNKIACVTGGAGVGKTTILREVHDGLYEQFCQQKGVKHHMEGRSANDVPHFSIKLAAPTGRAAKRIEEATGIEAITIHRLLRYSVPMDDDEFGLPLYSRSNRMPHMAILIDEASMLTKELRRALIDAMANNCIIRFFGDVNQLPPIDPNKKDGELLFSPFNADLKKFPSVMLTKNYRSEDGIIKVAQSIISNRIPLPNEQAEFHRVTYGTAMSKIAELASNVDFTLDANQIICPTKVNKIGTMKINLLMQRKFNQETDKINIYQKDKLSGSIITRSFKRGDKVLWTKNDYELGLMNGTLGRVLDFDSDGGSIFINADDRDIEVPPIAYGINPKTGEKFSYDPRTRLILGYAISTHASQGSQFDYVCYVVARSRAATRQNVYTGITRSKNYITVINVGGALNHAITNVTRLAS